MTGLPIPIAGLELEPTISLQGGTSRITQCAECGICICIPDCGSYSHRVKLGACPRCGRSEWWSQDSPVSVFVLDPEHEA